jgi:DNA-binding FadR family transcriptional regulator
MAIRAGDGNAAEAAMRAHVVRSATTLIERQSGGRI